MHSQYFLLGGDRKKERQKESEEGFWIRLSSILADSHHCQNLQRCAYRVSLLQTHTRSSVICKPTTSQVSGLLRSFHFWICTTRLGLYGLQKNLTQLTGNILRMFSQIYEQNVHPVTLIECLCKVIWCLIMF